MNKVEQIVENIRKKTEDYIKISEITFDNCEGLYSQPDKEIQIEFIQKLIDKDINVGTTNYSVFLSKDKNGDKHVLEVKTYKIYNVDEIMDINPSMKSIFFYIWEHCDYTSVRYFDSDWEEKEVPEEDKKFYIVRCVCSDEYQPETLQDVVFKENE